MTYSPPSTINLVPVASGGDTTGQAIGKAKDIIDAIYTILNAIFPDMANVKTVSFVSEYDNGNSGTSKTIDWSNGQHQKLTLTGDPTISFSNTKKAHHHLKLIQDATGGRTFTLPEGYWPGGVAYDGSNAEANQIDMIGVYHDGSDYFYSIMGLDYQIPA